jgi:hypothetical protein
MQNYFLIEYNYSQSVIYNFKIEVKFWKNYNVVKIIILSIVVSSIIVKLFKFLFSEFCKYLFMINIL